MVKRRIGIKVAFIAMLQLVLMMPTVACAQQKHDSFFNDYVDVNRYDNVDIEFTLDSQPFGEDAPLDGGVAILVASAAGYAFLKRKKQQDSKKSNDETR